MWKDKKQLSGVTFAVVMVVCLAGCGTSQYQESAVGKYEENWGYFTVISKYGIGEFGSYYIVYANDTKVMYVLSDGNYNHGAFTPLYNSDGTLQIYEENED